MTQKICLKYNTFYDEECDFCKKEAFEEKLKHREELISTALSKEDRRELAQIDSDQKKRNYFCVKCGMPSHGYKYCPECLKKIMPSIKEHQKYWGEWF